MTKQFPLDSHSLWNSLQTTLSRDESCGTINLEKIMKNCDIFLNFEPEPQEVVEIFLKTDLKMIKKIVNKSYRN